MRAHLVLIHVQKKRPRRLILNFWDDPHYQRYITKNGYHFTDKLAASECAKLVNVDKSQHRWSAAEVATAIKAIHSAQFAHKVTDGDLMFAANMYYSDFFPKSMATEAAVLNAVISIADDPDGYEGQIFTRWLADVMRVGGVNWAKFC